MNFDIKQFDKNSNKIEYWQVVENLDEYANMINEAIKSYPNDIVERLDKVDEQYEKEKLIINAWYDKYSSMVKGKKYGDIFEPNTNSLKSVVRKMETELDTRIINEKVYLQSSEPFILYVSYAYNQDGREDLLERIKVGRVYEKIKVIMAEKQVYFYTHDNYEVKSKEMHDFMWNWNIDFNNKLFNKQLVDDETLEKCWEFYQEIKKELETVNKKIIEFRERGEK